MLAAMIDAAVHWIKAGLPMINLKIVLYSTNPLLLDHSSQASRGDECVKLFLKKKEHYEKMAVESKVSIQTIISDDKYEDDDEDDNDDDDDNDYGDDDDDKNYGDDDDDQKDDDNIYYNMI